MRYFFIVRVQFIAPQFISLHLVAVSSLTQYIHRKFNIFRYPGMSKGQSTNGN